MPFNVLRKGFAVSSTSRLVEELVQGMTIDRNVEVQGAVLLNAGTILTDANIQALKKWRIRSVLVRVWDDASSDPAHTETALAMPDFQTERNRLDELFSTTGDDQQMKMLHSCLLQYLEERHGR